MRWRTKAELPPARVFLVGFMGSGKTTVGHLLADAMGFDFIDLDQQIEERAGARIARIFEVRGERAFRALEGAALAEAAAAERVVVATGGGVMTSPSHRELMAKHGTTVWLNPGFDTIVRRLSNEPPEQRPLFVDRSQAEELYTNRLDSYTLADLRVDIGADEEARAVAERIATLLEGRRCAT